MRRKRAAEDVEANEEDIVFCAGCDASLRRDEITKIVNSLPYCKHCVLDLEDNDRITN